MKTGFGGGLTEANIEVGLTIKEKLEEHYPHFERIHAILGERANINPSSLALLGMPNHNEVYGYEEDKPKGDEQPYEDDGQGQLENDYGEDDKYQPIAQGDSSFLLFCHLVYMAF